MVVPTIRPMPSVKIPPTKPPALPVRRIAMGAKPIGWHLMPLMVILAIQGLPTGKSVKGRKLGRRNGHLGRFNAGNAIQKGVAFLTAGDKSLAAEVGLAMVSIVVDAVQRRPLISTCQECIMVTIFGKLLNGLG